MKHYDLIVIGSGPAGQRAAIQAAKLGKSVAVVERAREVGGVCLNTGTIPSKTMREAVLDLSGFRQRSLYGESFRGKEHITAQDLFVRCDLVRHKEREVVKSQLWRNGVTMHEGTARITGPHEVLVDDGIAPMPLTTTNMIIAVGTTPGVPRGIEVDHHTILTSDDILQLKALPKSMIIVGAGVIGTEYATMFATLGVRVTLMDKRTELLEMVDREMANALMYHARALRVTFRLGEEVASVQAPAPQALHLVDEDGQARAPHAPIVTMKSGKQLAADIVMVSAGRVGATEGLGLENAGLTCDDRGRIPVNEHYQTAVPHIYAVGDVIGFPSLASTGMEQGRIAVCHAYNVEAKSMPALFPFGIYAVPELAWVGATEEELTAQSVPFETGIGRYKDTARGQILGDHDGMLKLIFHLETRQILGVWVLGTHAAELVHIGQSAMALGGTLDFFVNNVFNYPTLAECYKVAALDGINKLRSLGHGTSNPTHVAAPEAFGDDVSARAA